MKGEDGIPVPYPDTYPGLVLAFALAAEGKTNREVAKVVNTKGYRTAGNMGNRPFSKDTVAGILQNRFYIGQLPDGNGGWIKAKHQPLVTEELFNMAQQQRERRRHSKNGSIVSKARTYSLTGLVWCGICRSKAGIHKGYRGKPRVYCRERTQGADCNCKATFLEIYEAQIEWYLENFVIPEDYQERIIEAHRKLEKGPTMTQTSGETSFRIGYSGSKSCTNGSI